MSLYQPVTRNEDVDPSLVEKPQASSTAVPAEEREPGQLPLDIVDEAGMESFPCSDPPSYTRSHA